MRGGGRRPPGRLSPIIFGTGGTIAGAKLNDEPIDYPGPELKEQYRGPNASLPYVVGAHRSMQKAHIYEDLIQLVDWIRKGRPTIAAAQHARLVIETFDAAYRSAQTGQAQILTTTFEPLS